MSCNATFLRDWEQLRQGVGKMFREAFWTRCLETSHITLSLSGPLFHFSGVWEGTFI